jgi:hypothetical protein
MKSPIVQREVELVNQDPLNHALLALLVLAMAVLPVADIILG